MLSTRLLCSSRHHPAELLVVELPVAVQVGLFHKGLRLLLGEPLAQRRRHPTELLRVDQAVVVLVEQTEGLAKLLETHIKQQTIAQWGPEMVLFFRTRRTAR